MKKLLILALLAATAASPVLAQERGGRDRGFSQPRAERSMRAERPRGPAARPDRQRAQRPNIQRATPEMRRGDNRGAGRERFRGQRPASVAQPATGVARPDRRWSGNEARRNQAARPDRVQERRWGNEDRDRARWNGNDRNRPGLNDRDRNRNDRRWNRNDDRRWDRDRDRNWNRDRRWDRDGNRDWNRNRGWDRDNRRDWNRDWRRDRRYDWRSYRNNNRHVYRIGRYYAPSGWSYGYRRFNSGFYLESMLFGSNYWIGDPWAYRLPPASGPYRWVRYFDDVLLVDIRNGYVVDVIHSFFW